MKNWRDPLLCMIPWKLGGEAGQWHRRCFGGENRLLFSQIIPSPGGCGFSVPRLEPRLFSFNSPLRGVRRILEGLEALYLRVDVDYLIQDR